MGGWHTSCAMTSQYQLPVQQQWPRPRPSALPLEPRPYQQMLRGPLHRWWSPLFSLLLLVFLKQLVDNLTFLQTAMTHSSIDCIPVLETILADNFLHKFRFQKSAEDNFLGLAVTVQKIRKFEAQKSVGGTDQEWISTGNCKGTERFI